MKSSAVLGCVVVASVSAVSCGKSKDSPAPATSGSTITDLSKIPNIAKGFATPKNGSAFMLTAKSLAACNANTKLDEIFFQRAYKEQLTACIFDKIRAANPSKHYYTGTEDGVAMKYKFTKTSTANGDNFYIAMCENGVQTSETTVGVADGKNISISFISKNATDGYNMKNVISGVIDSENTSDPWTSMTVNQTYQYQNAAQFATISKAGGEFNLLQSFVSGGAVTSYWIAKWDAANGYARESGGTAQSFNMTTMDIPSSDVAYKSAVDATAAPTAGTADFSFASAWDCQAADGETFADFPADAETDALWDSCVDALYVKHDTYTCTDPLMPVIPEQN